MVKLTSEERKELYDKYAKNPKKLALEMDKMLNIKIAKLEEKQAEEIEEIEEEKEIEEIEEEKPKKAESTKDPLDKNVHISFRFTKRDFLKFAKEMKVKPTDKLEYGKIKKTELEIYNFVEDRILLGKWDRELEDLAEYKALDESKLNEAQKSEIKRIENMLNVYESVKIQRSSKDKLPTTNHYQQMFIDMLAKLSSKTNWFVKKYSLV